MKYYEKQYLSFKTEIENTFKELEFRLSLFYKPFSDKKIHSRYHDGLPYSNRKVQYRNENTIPQISRWIFDYLISFQKLKNYSSIFENWESKYESLMEALLYNEKFKKLLNENPNIFSQLINEPQIWNQQMLSFFYESEKDEIINLLEYKEYRETVIEPFFENFHFDKLTDIHLIIPPELSAVKSLLIPYLISLKDTFEGDQQLLISFIDSLYDEEDIFEERPIVLQKFSSENSFQLTNDLNSPNIFIYESEKVFKLFHEFLDNIRNSRSDGQFNAADVGFIIWALRQKEKYLHKSFNHVALSKFMEVYCKQVNNVQLKFSKDSIRNRSLKQIDFFNKVYEKYKDDLDISL
jgi:hypothetical protein